MLNPTTLQCWFWLSSLLPLIPEPTLTFWNSSRTVSKFSCLLATFSWSLIWVLAELSSGSILGPFYLFCKPSAQGLHTLMDLNIIVLPTSLKALFPAYTYLLSCRFMDSTTHLTSPSKCLFGISNLTCSKTSSWLIPLSSSPNLLLFHFSGISKRWFRLPNSSCQRPGHHVDASSLFVHHSSASISKP